MDRIADEELEATALLAEPVRRTLYLYVLRDGGEVGRDQAARAMGIERGLAAFHLDKLADAGLLEVTYRRLSGRSGPGAGRPNKLYRRSAHQIDLTLPERRYALIAHLLAGAVASSPAATAALGSAALALGESIGAGARAAAGRRAGRDALMLAAKERLARLGFEPYHAEGGTIRLRNCPFDALANEHRELICGANLELIDGVLAGLRATGIAAALEPGARHCCVALKRALQA